MQRVSVLILLASAAFAQPHGRLPEYALVLEDPPVAQKISSRAALQSAGAQSHLAKVRNAQRGVLTELAARKVRVAATSQTLVNAIFVRVSHQDAPALRTIPGVKWIQYLPPSKLALAAAEDLIRVPAAWSLIGGNANAGAGVRIGIIDTGIDQTHPGFRDTGFTAPSGFPAGDAAFTNNKVIVARSYVSMQIDTDPTFSTPDDLSPRDRQGHGTAIAMIAAGVQNTGPLGSITGIAPKAFLGNYKVFGSPGVNEYTTRSSWIQALTDATNDRMDIVTLSLGEGDPAFYGALDTGTNVCGEAVCDVGAAAVENATRLGVLVVAAAGNVGDQGQHGVTKYSIASPGSAPNALTVGASQNSHLVYQSLRADRTSFAGARGLFGDGPRPTSAITATAKDITGLGDTSGLGCTALPAGTLTGSFALIQRGTCTFADKVNFAQAAGAVGVILYQSEGVDDFTQRLYVQNTAIPAFMIGNSDGKALKSFLGGNPNTTVTLDPAYATADNAQFNTIATFSSRGPVAGNFAATRDFGLKPEIVAPGTHIYTATQNYDPTSDTYNATRYTTVNGTSYSVAMAAGVAAMAKARIPNLNTPGRLKSAVVNTATSDLLGGVRVTDAGAGKLNAADAVNVSVTLEPAAISFGPVTTLPVNRNLTITNVSASPATLFLTVRATTIDAAAHVALSQNSVNLSSGGSATVTVSLTGTKPVPGDYEGFIDVTGAGPALHLPFFYVVGDGVPYDIFAMLNGVFTGIPNDVGWLLLFRTSDRFGVPVANAPVTFNVVSGGGRFNAAGGDKATDLMGNAGVFVDLGPRQSDQIFTGRVGTLTQRFEGFARRLPTINPSGVVNAGTFQVGQGLQPGSYISIFGSDLSDTTQVETTLPLPVSLGQVSVSFDGGGLSIPGRFHFISPTQINVQLPWEFAGQSSVKMKVTLYGYIWSAVYDVPLATYSPGIFPGAITDGASNLPISAANPAKRGGSIVIYANGLGPVSVPQTTGAPSSSTQLVGTNAGPVVTIGGVQGTIIFSGLTPGLVATYQVNVGIPTNAPTGTQPLKLSIGGQDVTVNLIVQ
ncbi:MAG: S8 family serine peptidase [Candidatus Solibacter sp.]